MSHLTVISLYFLHEYTTIVAENENAVGHYIYDIAVKKVHLK
jgi:hypothetical protein